MDINRFQVILSKSPRREKAAPKVWKLLDTAALRVSEAGLGHTAGPCYSPVGHNLTKHQHQTRSL